MIKKVLKIFGYLLGIPIILILLVLLGAWLKYTHIVNSIPNNSSAEFQPGKYGKYVNNFIGTGGFPAWVCGMNFPGATVPFGIIRLSPETASLYTNTRAYNTSGYYYGDNKIIGFTHTRLAGTGATDGGHFLITPTIKSLNDIDFSNDYYHHFSHTNEVAFPGYYSVKVEEGIVCELTSTERVGLHRYTFPSGSSKGILFNVTNTLGAKRAENAVVSIDIDSNVIAGSVKTYGGFSGRYDGITVYFFAEFDKSLQDFAIWDGAEIIKHKDSVTSDKLILYLQFEDNDSISEVEFRLGLSYVSIENAKLNLNEEAKGYLFNELVNKAVSKWEEKLSLINIKGARETEKAVFYSALYRSFQMPTNFNDVHGEYLGFDKNIHQANGFNYYTDLSLWDTFRTVHPLYILIANKEQRDMIVSMVEMARQGGWLPRWPSGGGYTNSMFGTPADVMLTGSYLKGITEFDVEFAYAKMKETALAPTPKGSPFSGRRSIESYLKYGYCPNDIKERSVSRTLEYTWSDHCISLLANELGYENDSKMFSKHSKFYKNLWNPETQYFQARNSDGNFVEDFDPLQLTYTDWDGEITKGYVEGSALQWRWAVPFDSEGLIFLFKDKEYFIHELNDFFQLSDPQLASWNPGSYYWHGNQPDIYSVYLFNDAGRPDLTQKWVRWILDNKYDNSYTGIDGNDDGATLSAWYIFSSLGFYPIAGTDIYQIGAPLFEEATINLGENELRIISENYSPDNIYVKSLFINDCQTDRRWIKHSEIADGGVIKFVMSKNPSK